MADGCFESGKSLNKIGKQAQAEVDLRTALKIRTDLLGAEHEDTLKVLAELGDACRRQSKNEEAARILREAYDAYRAAKGAADPNALKVANLLCSSLSALTKYDEAEILFLEVIAACSDKYGASHKNTLVFKQGLGGLFDKQEKLEDAEPLLREALAGRRKLASATADKYAKTDLYASMGSLALVLQKRKGSEALAEAEALYREALTQTRKDIEVKSADVTMGFQVVFGEGILGVDKSDAGLEAAFAKVDANQSGKIDLDELKAYILSVYETGTGPPLEDKFIKDMVETADTNKDGEIDLDEFKAIMRAGPQENKISINLMKNLGALLKHERQLKQEQGLKPDASRMEECEHLYRRCLTADTELYGPASETTLTTMETLAMVMHYRDKDAEAEEMLRRVLIERRASLGLNNEDTLETALGLATVLRSISQGTPGQGISVEAASKATEAEALLQEALAASRQALGEEHAMSVRIKKHLAWVSGTPVLNMSLRQASLMGEVVGNT